MQTLNSLRRGWAKMKPNRKVIPYKLKTDRITLKNAWLPYILCYKRKWQTYSFRSYLDCILALPKEGCHRRFKPCCNDFVVKNVSKMFFFMLPFASSFKIFINMVTFLYVKANSKKIGAEILFPSFFRKMVMSASLLRFKANYLQKMRGYP